MRETLDAKRAFIDYVALGSDRSLEKLLAHYRQQTANGSSVPSLRFRTLADWSRFHNWQVRLAEIAEAERQAVVARGIADKQNRIDADNERWLALREGVKAWAEEYREAPGGARSGYYARKVAAVKVLGQFEEDERGRRHFVATGELTEVEEWALDTGLLKELRELEKQAAIELRQWTERREHTFDLSGLSDEELASLERVVSKLAQSG
jgi:uncharacterized protein YjiS (DUF1127 family)